MWQERWPECEQEGFTQSSRHGDRKWSHVYGDVVAAGSVTPIPWLEQPQQGVLRTAQMHRCGARPLPNKQVQTRSRCTSGSRGALSTGTRRAEGG